VSDCGCSWMYVVMFVAGLVFLVGSVLALVRMAGKR
jgi:hypothetical protein